MQKKVNLFVFSLLVIFSISLLSAATINETKVSEAVSCLQDTIDEKTCDTLSTEEKIFSTLAVNECKAELLADANENECWPKTNCDALTTAKAVIALEKNTNTAQAEQWLETQRATPTELEWLLQIESPSATSCTISYSGSTFETGINEQKQITSGAGSCLSLDETGYWLAVDPSRSLGCTDTNYTISCDNSFTTNVLFRKDDGETLYVADATSSAAAEGTTTEEIKAYCFLKSGTCDYESTLWGALALDAVGESIDAYLPYLITFSDEAENQKFLPNAFLYILTGSNDFKTKLLLDQKAGEYWSESGDRYYDTAVALLALRFEDPLEKQNAITWLFNNQDATGCWQGSVRNTGFIVYSLGATGGTSNGDGITPTPTTCEGEGYSCLSGSKCLDIGGDVLDLSCSTPFKCCSIAEPEQTCNDLGGTICNTNTEICVSGRVESDASDVGVGEFCCVAGTCEEPTEPTQSQCDRFGGTCRSSCGVSEKELSFTCPLTQDVCCGEDLAPTDDGGGSSWWIWVLVLLIIGILIAIFFRDKVRIILLRVQSMFKKSGDKGPAGAPPTPPSGSLPPPSSGPGLTRRPVRRAPPKKRRKSPKELDNVLKRLKEMGN